MSDLDYFETHEIVREFYYRKGFEYPSMLDELKLDLFFKEMNNFTLDQLEVFIKTIKNGK